MSQHVIQFDREKTALKYYLVGAGFSKAVKALGFVERYHVGTRKDGVTPELHHQIRICLSIIQLKDIHYLERCLVAALLHDVQEDYQIAYDTIVVDFGKEAAEDTWALTKKFGSNHKTKEEYINAIAVNPVASIVKGADRNDNLDSMIGVFQLQKMKDYAEEARTLFLPMLKRASKLFPEQLMAYAALMQQMKKKIVFTSSYTKECADSQNYFLQLEASILMIDQQSKKIKELEENLANANGPGTMGRRHELLLKELEKRWPHPAPFDSTKAYERYFLEMLDTILPPALPSLLEGVVSEDTKIDDNPKPTITSLPFRQTPK